MTNWKQRLHEAATQERGSGEMVAFLLIIPIVFLFTVGFAVTAFYRQMVEAPLQPILNNYTQMFAAYGTNTLPDWAAANPGQTVSGLMRQAFVASGRVKDDRGQNVIIECGPLGANGQITNVVGLANPPVIYADTPVACRARITVESWDGIALTNLPDILFGDTWVGSSSAFVDRGANPNVN